MVAYPNFQADPNAVPKVNGVPGIFESIQKGMMMAQLPEQLRNQREQTRLATEKAQMENQYYPQMQQAQIGELQGRSNLYKAQGDAALMQLRQQQAFYDALQNSAKGAPPQGYGQPQAAPGTPQPSQENGQPQPALGAPSQNGGYYNPLSQAAPQNAPQSGGYYNSQPQQGYGDPQVIDRGDPSLYYIDELYQKNPMLRSQFDKQGFQKKTSTQIDPSSGRIISTTVYPSGRKEAVITGPGPQEAEFQKTVGANQAKTYNEYSNRATSAVRLNSEFQALDDLMSSANFDSAVGPVDAYLNKKGAATKGTQKAYGNAAAITGRIHTQIVGSMPGNAQASKINLVNSIKPNVTDPENVFRGKAQALRIAQEYEVAFYKNMGRLMKDGASEIDALDQTENEVSWDNYKDRMLKAAFGNGKEYYKSESAPQKTYTDAEVHAATDHLSVEELRRALSGGQQ